MIIPLFQATHGLRFSSSYSIAGRWHLRTIFPIILCVHSCKLGFQNDTISMSDLKVIAITEFMTFKLSFADNEMKILKYCLELSTIYRQLLECVILYCNYYRL